MPRIIEYPNISSSLDDSFAFVIDSETMGTKKLMLKNLLNGILGLNDGAYVSQNLMRYKGTAELEDSSNNKYYASNAAPMSAYYIYNSSTAAAFASGELPVQEAGILMTFGERSSSDNKLRAAQFYVPTGTSSSILPNVYYRYVSGSNITPWGILGEYRKDLPTMTAPTMKNSFTRTGGGGFIQHGTKAHIQLTVSNSYTSSILSAGTETQVATGFPSVAFGLGAAPISVTMIDTSNVYLQKFILDAYVRQGNLYILSKSYDGPSISGNPDFTLSFCGTYYTDAWVGA